jgi:hypothetical protein
MDTTAVVVVVAGDGLLGWSGSSADGTPLRPVLGHPCATRVGLGCRELVGDAGAGPEVDFVRRLFLERDEPVVV